MGECWRRRNKTLPRDMIWAFSASMESQSRSRCVLLDSGEKCARVCLRRRHNANIRATAASTQTHTHNTAPANGLRLCADPLIMFYINLYHVMSRSACADVSACLLLCACVGCIVFCLIACGVACVCVCCCCLHARDTPRDRAHVV